MATALFLDRDGVINEEKHGSYIFHPGEFRFYPGVLEALKAVRNHFDYILVVTNQRGIGRGFMQESDLLAVHEHMLQHIEAEGGRIDGIYFAPHLEDDHPRRKPNIGMAMEAREQFPDLDFRRSIMIGNNLSDMEFGYRLQMQTVFLHTTKPKLKAPHKWVDEQFPSLESWARHFLEKKKAPSIKNPGPASEPG